MDVHHLVTMSNQIGEYFASMPDRDQAVEQIAKHLKSTWDPRMRHTLLAYYDMGGGSNLLPIVVDALSQHRDRLA